jgi:hypothetical protein
MKEIKRKFPLSIFEILLVIIIIPIVFYCWTKLLWHPWFENFLEAINSDLPEKFVSFWGPSVIVGFNILWIVGMYWLPLKKIRIKIYATLFLLTISAATLIFWLMTTALRNAMH